MGLFSKTEEEIKREEENRRYSQLNNVIWESSLDSDQRQVIIEYLDKVKRGYPNDFGDFETLKAVIFKMIDSDYDEYEDFETIFPEIIRVYHIVVNPSDPNVERLRERFIQDFVGKDGLLDLELFDESMYGLFQDKEDYFEIMNIIASDSEITENFSTVLDYITRVSKFCLTQDILKRDVISYLSHFYDVLDEDYKKYNEDCLTEAKKRIGIYSISQKELATVDSKMRQIQEFFNLIDIHLHQLTEEKEAISSLVKSGRKEIKDQEQIIVSQLRSSLDTERTAMVARLDQYLLDLEETMKAKSDETFRQVLETYQNQVQEFRNIFKGYSISASKDLLELQKVTEESIKRLQDYVRDNPELRELIQRADQETIVHNKLVKLLAEEDIVPAEKSKEEVVIPGYEERIMVPYRHMILPSEISTNINPFFDERIPFSKRKDKLLSNIEERTRNGEIFHKKVPQIAVDIMEGDWPYLWGPSGTGKSFIAKQVASLLGMDITKAGKITEPYSIMGYNDPQGRYQITPSFIAALYGNLLFLDEMDNGNPDTQVVLNDLYSELLNKIEGKDEICQVTFGTDVQVDIHPNFRMIAAGNTSGEGENETFSSRGKMDESIQERMTPIYIDYDDRVEQRILKEYPVWYSFFVDFRKVCREYASRVGLDAAQGITTTRDAAALAKYIKHNSKPVDQVLAERFIQIKDSEYRAAIANAIAKLYNVDYDHCEAVRYTGKLESVKKDVLAKKFVYACKHGVE